MRIHVKPLTAAAGNCPVHPHSTSVLHPAQLCSSVRSTFNRVERIGGVTASCLRGISQIFLAENVLSGLLILAAMTLVSPQLAACAILGVAVETLTASVLRFEGVSRGLHGYNGALVGAAVAASGAPVVPAVTFTIVGALATIPLQAALVRIEALPVLTAPFCCVAGLLLGPLHGTWVSVEPVLSPEPLTPTQWVTGLGSGILRGFSEVVLADGLLAGVLIIAGLAVASRSICGFAILGSIFGLGRCRDRCCFLGFEKPSAARLRLPGRGGSGCCGAGWDELRPGACVHLAVRTVGLDHPLTVTQEEQARRIIHFTRAFS